MVSMFGMCRIGFYLYFIYISVIHRRTVSKICYQIIEFHLFLPPSILLIQLNLFHVFLCVINKLHTPAGPHRVIKLTHTDFGCNLPKKRNTAAKYTKTTKIPWKCHRRYTNMHCTQISQSNLNVYASVLNKFIHNFTSNCTLQTILSRAHSTHSSAFFVRFFLFLVYIHILNSMTCCEHFNEHRSFFASSYFHIFFA